MGSVRVRESPGPTHSPCCLLMEEAATLAPTVRAEDVDASGRQSLIQPPGLGLGFGLGLGLQNSQGIRAHALI